MPKFCPTCGKPLEFENAEICPSCGKNISAAPASATTQTSTSMDRQEIFGRAIPFFATKTYAVQTQTDYVIAFESQNRDVNWIIFLVFCCLGLVPAVIYYYWFTHSHQVTVSLSGSTDIKVTAIGNTEQAKKDAAEFMMTLL
jgi:endogenous inhibitor of DNA gyrase (YacG/DUF329 family)